MKLKYYLRGIGIGIIVTTLILTIAYHLQGSISDEEVIKRAEALGMVMDETKDSLFPEHPKETLHPDDSKDTETESVPETKDLATESETQSETESAVEVTKDNEIESATEVTKEPETDANTESTKEPETEPVKETQEPETEPVAQTQEPTLEPETEPHEDVWSYTLHIYGGMYSEEVSWALEKGGIISNAWEFNDFLCNNGYGYSIIEGTYEIRSDMSWEEIARLITTWRE